MVSAQQREERAVNPNLLTELSHLFMVEAYEADERHDHVEGDRLWNIADALHEEAVQIELRTLRAS
jgi:hypothetical protein